MKTLSSIRKHNWRVAVPAVTFKVHGFRRRLSCLNGRKGSAMELKLHHVNYSTKDVGAVAEFYRSLFNMKPVPSYGDAGSRRRATTARSSF
jgi:hypothetical protein